MQHPPPTVSLLVQDLKEPLDPLERILITLVRVDHSIAVALHHFRFGFAQPARQKCCRNDLRSNVKSDNAAPLTIESEARRGEEIARRRRRPAKTPRGFRLQTLQVALAAAPRDTAI